MAYGRTEQLALLQRQGLLDLFEIQDAERTDRD